MKTLRRRDAEFPGVIFLRASVPPRSIKKDHIELKINPIQPTNENRSDTLVVVSLILIK